MTKKIGCELIGLLFIFVAIQACDNTAKVPNIDLKVTVNRFDLDVQEAYGNKSENDVFNQKYDQFLPFFCDTLLQLRPEGDTTFNVLKLFVRNNFIGQLNKAVDSIFGNDMRIHEDFTQAFKFYKSVFPDFEVPEIYTVVTGSRLPGALTNQGLLIGLDMYLGRNSEFYGGFEQFLRNRYQPEYMVPNAINTLVLDKMAQLNIEEPVTGPLLENIVFWGKVMYISKLAQPNTSDSLIIGYTTAQLKGCIENEHAIWTQLVSNNYLYANDEIVKARFLKDAPFTSGLSKESPGKLGWFVGWQMVKQYMEKNPSTTVEELIALKDYKKVLEKSGYRP